MNTIEKLDALVQDMRSNEFSTSWASIELGDDARHTQARAIKARWLEILEDPPIVFIPPMWLYIKAKLWTKDSFMYQDSTSNSYTYEVSRLRLRETAEDSTLILTNLDAPDRIECQGGSYENLEKVRALTVAYVLERFVSAKW